MKYYVVTVWKGELGPCNDDDVIMEVELETHMDDEQIVKLIRDALHYMESMLKTIRGF